MSKRQPKPASLEQVRQSLGELGCKVTDLPDGHVLARKRGCAAILGLADDGTVKPLVRPGTVVNGEIARLIDRGYQKFFKTADAEVPARPDEMDALAHFQNEVRYACGIPALYNESLGSVSDRYIYDRIWFRDEGRQPKPWEAAAATELTKSEPVVRA